MKTRLLASLAGSLLLLALAAPAFAGGSIGGDDETSEDASHWVVATPTPGTAAGGGAAAHVLLSEICVTPTAGEFIEILNPTGAVVDLSNFCLSDDWYTPGGPSGYFQRPSASYSLVGVTTDYDVCFPPGTTIGPGNVLTVATSATGFFATYGTNPDFEIRDDDAAVPTMVDVGGNAGSFSTALLTNSSEFVVLYCWDGLSDLVCDVDYAAWGDITSSGNQVDKTGLSVDGPDADAIASTYNNDTPLVGQARLTSPGTGFSLQRTSASEGAEGTNGNGCTTQPTPTRSSTWGRVKAIYR